MSTSALLFAPVAHGSPTALPPLKVAVPDAPTAAFELFLADGSLTIASAGSAPPHVQHIAALALRKEEGSGENAWYVVPRSVELGINGMSPPLALTRVEPGSLISIGDRFWMLSALWQPNPRAAPDELKDKSCPICGGELSLAPVVQCVCGRWMHLEKPEQPDDTNALNCYLVSDSCGNCGRPTSLTPQILPEIPERLLQPPDEDDWFPSELQEQEATT